MNSLLNQLGGRKFVCVAGLVAAAAGSVYMYKRIWGSEEALVITDEQGKLQLASGYTTNVNVIIVGVFFVQEVET